MTTVASLTSEAPLTTTGGRRANALAERLEQGARALEPSPARLSDVQWQTLLLGDGRKVGVVVHHVATMYPLEMQLSQLLAAGSRSPVSRGTSSTASTPSTRPRTTRSRRRRRSLCSGSNSAAAAAAIRALSDDELDRAVTVSLNDDAPLTCQFFLEDHPSGTATITWRRSAGRWRPPRDRSATKMTSVMTCETAVPSARARAIKARQQAMWASGDFAVIGATLQIVGELSARRRTCARVTACWTWRLAAATRRWPRRGALPRVTSTDYVPALLDRGRRRADGRRIRQRHVRGRRCRGAAVSGRQLRHRALDIRRDVRARPRSAPRAELIARVQARRPHRAGELDAVRLPRRAPPPRREARAADPRAFSRRVLWGRDASHPRAVPGRQRDRARRAIVRIPLPVGAPLGATCSGTSTDRCTQPSLALDARRPGGPRGRPVALLHSLRRRRARRTRRAWRNTWKQ